MPKPPRELMKQIEIIADVTDSLNNIINDKKLKIEYYGKDFLEPLTKIRTMAMELRNELELFQHNMERAVTDQYYSSDRFASERDKISIDKTDNVINLFLSRKDED